MRIKIKSKSNSLTHGEWEGKEQNDLSKCYQRKEWTILIWWSQTYLKEHIWGLWSGACTKTFPGHSQPYKYVRCSLHTESAAPHLVYTDNIYSNHSPAHISQSALLSTALASLLDTWISEFEFCLIRVTDPQLRTYLHLGIAACGLWY